jgi:esterase/lipase
MELFAWDTKHNIIPLLTFSDWSDYPNAIDALHEAKLGINVDRYFNFNASAMFECVEDDPIRREQWDKSISSFKDLFEEIENKEAISVKLTKDVCEKRGKLEKQVAQLHKSIRREMDQVSAMRNVYVSLKQYESEKDRCKDFITPTNEVEYRETPIPNNQHTTNCMDCKATCHDNCRQSKDEDKMHCSMMDPDGNCIVCSCNWQKHKNLPYIFEAVIVEKSQINQNLDQTHLDAKDKLQQINDELKSMAHELIKHDRRIKEHIENIRITQDQLDKIAIRKTTSIKRSTIRYEIYFLVYDRIDRKT